MWPAVIFAASRNDNVKGRTRTLDDSIRTKNGFNQSGAPSGRKCAVVALGLNINLEIINLSHSGRPKDRVIIRWLDRLKQYGTKPIRFREIISINVEETINVIPLRDEDKVRASWEYITSIVNMKIAKRRELLVNNEASIIAISIGVNSKNTDLIGSRVLEICGSNVEKISGIMQNSGTTYLRLWRSLVYLT